MTNEYELSQDSREAMIFTKDQLLAPLPEGAQPTPHTDAVVAARNIAYYEGHAAQDPLAHFSAAAGRDDLGRDPDEAGDPATVSLLGGGTEPPTHPAGEG